MKRFLYLFAFGAMILGVGSAARATNIAFSFDPDGAGSGVASRTVTTFDWLPGNALADNALLGSPALIPGTLFDLYFQARLGSITNANLTPTSTEFAAGSQSAAFIDVAGLTAIPQGEITVVAGFTEIVTDTSVAINGDVTSSFSLAGAQNVNFIKIYYDGPVPASIADDLAGTGFDQGTLILDATVVSNNGSFAVDVSEGTPLFDGVGADDYGGLTSVTGSGGVQLTAVVNSYDSMFFGPEFNPMGLVTLALTNTSNITPFDQVNPSMQFSSDGMGGAAITPNLGNVNGSPTIGTPPFDFQFQADANSSFQVVPEPSSLMLCAIGALGMLGGWRRRRQNGATAAA